MRRRDDIIWREVDDQIVGLDLRSSRYFTLNATGARLWALLGDHVETEELVDALLARFPVDRTAATADVDAFVKSMFEEGLLEPGSDPASDHSA